MTARYVRGHEMTVAAMSAVLITMMTVLITMMTVMMLFVLVLVMSMPIIGTGMGAHDKQRKGMA